MECRKLSSVAHAPQVAKMRSVCKRMDAMCGSHLNLGFRNAEKYHTQLMKKFKSRKVGHKSNMIFSLLAIPAFSAMHLGKCR